MVHKGDEGQSARASLAQVALWVEGFLAPSYGPWGGLKLIEQPDGHGRLVASGAVALREAAITKPDLQPFVDLVAAVQAIAGDQATLAGLLAARLVRRAVDLADAGLPVAQCMEGYQLAIRQVRAQLAALAIPDPAGASLASVAPRHPTWGAAVMAGLPALSQGGRIDLDTVDVRTPRTALPGDPGGGSASAGGGRSGAGKRGRGAKPSPPDAAWLPGVLLEPQHVPDAWLAVSRAGPLPLRILLFTEGWRPGPFRDDLSYRVTSAHGLSGFTAAEDARRAKVVRHVEGLGADLVVGLRELDEEVALQLARHGVAVWTDAPESAVRRLERATGATRTSRLDLADKASLGEASLHREAAGWMAAGRGAAATLLLPAETALGAELALDQGERLLRAGGLLLGDPMALPGAGAWQRAVARHLLAAAPAAPGKSPLAVEAAARALAASADDLVANAGGDPLEPASWPLGPGRAPFGSGVLDPAPCVRIAVVAAFEAALQMLRIDAHYRRRESGSQWLRGGGKERPKSMREMAGDVPPLM